MNNNREIKFRVWSKELNRFLGKEEYCLDLDGKLIFVGFSQNYHTDGSVNLKAVAPSSYALQQFTGLTDKNGKEIYEGDIVKFFRPELKIINQIEKIYICSVIYKDAEFRIEDLKNKTFHVLNSFSSKHIYEVIGNIFENSELIQIPEQQ